MRHPIAVFSILMASLGCADAGELRVSPVMLDVRAGATSTLTLRNDGKDPLPVQIRIFHWTGTGSEPVLEATRDVVVSPPAATLAPGTEYVVRVVRVSKQPVVGEESYRMIVDELPVARASPVVAVRFMLRYSIPVFFSAANASPPKIAWSVQKGDKGTVITATNSGNRRLRVADLKLVDGNGAAVAARPGLVGYALGQASASWAVPGNAVPRGPLKLTALTEAGAINAVVDPQTLR